MLWKHIDELIRLRTARGLLTDNAIACSAPINREEENLFQSIKESIEGRSMKASEWKNITNLVHIRRNGPTAFCEWNRVDEIINQERDRIWREQRQKEEEREVAQQKELEQLKKNRLVDQRRREQENLERERIREESERQRREEKEKRKRKRLERKRLLLENLRAVFFERFLDAESLYENSRLSSIARDEFDAEKIAFVRDWLNQNIPHDEKGERRLPDDHQVRAIASVNGDIQVIARAGSGKTMVLVYRTFFLLKHCGVSPDEILLLAFNRKAVVEIRKRLISLLNPDSAQTLKEEIHNKSSKPRPGTKEQIESEAVDTVARELGISLPHVLTFHALAYAIVHPEETILFDDKESGAKVLGLAVQSLIDDHLRTPEGYAEIRTVMRAYFRTDWAALVESGHHLRREKFIEYRRFLPRLALAGHQVKSFGEKIIADFLFEHGLHYRYERNFEAYGFNYKPDFTIFSGENKTSGIVIEYFGMKGDADYDEQSDKKKAYWTRQPAWKLLDFYPVDISGPGVESFRRTLKARLEKSGIACNPLSESEIWERIKNRAVDGFSECISGFIGKCRKLSLSVEALDRLIEKHTPMDPAEGGFLRLARRYYANYLARLSARGEEDFNGLMQRAALAVESGKTEFSKRTFAGDLKSLRHISVDEFQDFSELFHRLLGSIRRQVPPVELFCVGDDWQAINAFAGSDLRFFQKFSGYIGPSRQLYLPTNYRSVAKVVDVGNRLMRGLGEPAIAHNPKLGAVLLANLDQFVPAPVECRAHDPFDKTTPAILRIVGFALRRNHRVAILFRTNNLQWTTEENGKPSWKNGKPDQFLRFIRSHFPKDQADRISVSTAHQFKGLERAVVIIPDAVERSYPLIHPTWIFARLFGDTLEKLYEEERRIFYVALTRAAEALIIVTEGAKRSPFLNDIESGLSLEPIDWSKHFHPVTVVAKRIVRILNAAGKGDTPTRSIKDQLNASRFGWDANYNAWVQVMDAAKLDMTALRKEPWARDADGVEVTVEDAAQNELARYAINDGVWSCVHGNIPEYDG